MLFSAVVIFTNSAIAADEQQCFKNQWLFSGVPKLVDKGKEELSDIVGKTLSVSDSTKSASLVEPRSWQKVDPLEKLKDKNKYTPTRRTDFCGRLAKKLRGERSLSRREGRRQIVRRYDCECNAPQRPSLLPDDPKFNNLWGLNHPDNHDIDAPEAWDLSTGIDELESGSDSAPVIVAVIDTGIDYNHPDLIDNIWENPNEIPGNGIDDDGNGFVDDMHGINTITKSGNPMDDHGHGTHCAGTIGARGDNGIGVTGVNWRVKLIGVKFLSASGSGSTYNAIVGVDYITNLKLAGHNIVLSSNSWGGGGYSYGLSAAISRAKAAGLLFVAAAGNSGTNNDSKPHYPSSYAHSNVISVAATDQGGKRASFSCYGTKSVDIGAPGVYIASTYPGNRYVYMSGTSMATPHVSGALALLKAFSPALSWEALRDILYEAGKPSTAMAGITTTGKILNIANMLYQENDNPRPTPTPPPPPTATFTPTPVPSPTATATPTATMVPTQVSVSGRVLITASGGTKVALPSAKVQLNVNGKTYVDYSGSNGEFSFEGIWAPADYSIIVIAAGYQFSPVSDYLLGDASHELIGQTALFKLSGRVVTIYNEPIGGATVSAGQYGNYLTDSSGAFSFNIPYGSEYELIASAEDWHFSKNYYTGVILGDTERLFVGELD